MQSTSLRLFSFAVAVSTFATIGLEIMLTRVFSVSMYYHFAFLLISLALLGLAVAGVAVYLLPRFFRRERAPFQAGVCMLAFALSSALALWVALSTPISPKSWHENVGSLLLIYFATAPVFLFSGLAVTLAIKWAGSSIGRIYAYDLIGAAIGCIFVIPALAAFGAAGAILVNAALALGAALLFFLSDREAIGRRKVTAVAAVAAVAALVLLFLGLTEASSARFPPARNPEKLLRNRQVLFEKWNALSQITVAPSGAPDHLWIFIDADAATRIWSGEIAKDNFQAPRRIPEVRVASLAYAIRNRGTALIIGPGGGTDVTSALRHGVEKVVGVEINPAIVEDVMRGQFAEFAGNLYDDPRVDIIVGEGRSVIRRSDERFATIQATLIDTWAASTSGAFTLSENNIYTVEAFGEFFDRLEDGGVLTVTRWYDRSDPKEFLRLVSLARTALEERGVSANDVRKYLFLATDQRKRATLLASTAPLSAVDVETLVKECEEGALPILYSPLPVAGQLAGTRPGAHSLHEDAMLAAYLRAPSSEAHLATLDWDAAPPIDDRPFFFYTLRVSDLFALIGKITDVNSHNLGVLILLLLLLLSLTLTALFVVLPLFVFRRDALSDKRRAKLRVLGYFLCLGLAFILVEIGLMQRFVLFLGHPIHALAVALAGLLASSGLGSALSQRGVERFGVKGFVVRATAVLGALMLIYAFALTPMFHGLLGLPLAARIAIAGLLVSAPGLLMGCLLPCGVRVANELGEHVVPWAWGLNGATSVVGSVLAIFVSINAGFTVALIIGVAAYACGAAVLPRAIAD